MINQEEASWVEEHNQYDKTSSSKSRPQSYVSSSTNSRFLERQYFIDEESLDNRNIKNWDDFIDNNDEQLTPDDTSNILYTHTRSNMMKRFIY